MSPEISIIVPAYNASKTIRKTLDAILMQTYNDYEVIIVNDGSTDDTKELCEKIADNRFLIVNQQNRGLSEARNVGIKNARGKYLCFIDSDDWPEPDYLAKLKTLLEANESDMAVCGLRFIYPNYSELSRFANKCCFKKLFENDNFLALFETGLMNSSCNKLFLRKLIMEHPSICFRKMTVCEDVDFNIEYFRYSNSIVVTPDVLYNYDKRTSVLTKHLSDDAIYNYLLIHKKLLNLVPSGKHSFVDKFVYHQYMAIIMKLLQSCAMGQKTMRQTVMQLNRCMKESLVRQAFDSYKTRSRKEKLFSNLVKHRCWILLLAFFKIKN